MKHFVYQMDKKGFMNKVRCEFYETSENCKDQAMKVIGLVL